MPQIWAGVDIGKTHHHCVVLDAEGKRLLSRRVLNDEPELLALLADVLAIDEDAVWAVDVADGMAALLISVLLNHSQQLLYIPGLAVMGLNEQITGIDKLIAARFREHELTEIISSMPGIGPLLGAEFLAATAGDLSRYGAADRLASLAGVAPVPRESGNISGNLHRPRRHHRGLQRVFYTSALISIRNCDASRRFCERKRAEAKRHTQAVLALARRRVNVLWALIRDGRCYQSELPVTAAA
ncbi:transposase [Streptomyces sp. NPDC056831]|uniref:IS110 family transposase n=1 Tax=Streptomyces sp. NPDC056831 TaxID=3345954 RepID=UPI0036C8138D